MSKPLQNDVTIILNAAQAGDQDAAALLLPLVYDELRKLAQSRMAHMPAGQTLQPTALVHEAYLRLFGKGEPKIDSRRHFFFVAARAMHDILVEQARAKAGPTRGGDRHRVPLDDELLVNDKSTADEVLMVDDALADLERVDAEKAQIVRLRYFTGMSMAEIADVLGTSERSLHREWRFIKAWFKSRFDSAPI